MPVTYIELLKDPRWQKKRLEVFERDNWMCRNGHKDKPLHIHHKRYLPGHKPWDYELEDLETLCEDCHREEHEITHCRNDKEDVSQYELALDANGQVLFYDLSELKKLGFSILGFNENGVVFYKYRNIFTLAHISTSQLFDISATIKLNQEIGKLEPFSTDKGLVYYKVPQDMVSFYEVVDRKTKETTLIAGRSHKVMVIKEFDDLDAN